VRERAGIDLVLASEVARRDRRGGRHPRAGDLLGVHQELGDVRWSRQERGVMAKGM
jgi:hypothetical protein